MAYSAAALRGARAKKARVAAVTSACRIRLSPTRKVEMPMPGEAGEVGRRVEPAFGDDDAVARDFRRQPLADGEGGLEGPQIAVVDADQPRFEFERALQLIFLMNFK